MKKVIFGLVFAVVITVLSGCGATEQKPVTKNGEINGGGTVTKKQINDVQAKLQEIKQKVLKVQMDKTLSKEEKAQKIEALQAEIKKYTNTK